MKTFCELLATDVCLNIEITVDGEIKKYQAPLLEPIQIRTQGNLTQLTIDGFDVMPYVWFQDHTWHFEIEHPFYQWQHQVTGQGWLLKPQ